MRNFWKLLPYSVILSIGIMFGVFFTFYFRCLEEGALGTLLGIIGALAGTLLGALISRYFYKYDEKSSYIRHVQAVLFILSKQYNKYLNIKNHFDQYMNDKDRYIKTQSLLVSSGEWFITKKDVVNLNNDGSSEIINIIYEIIYILEYEEYLLQCINDYNKYRDPIIKKIQESQNLSFTQIEVEELKRLLDYIDKAIKKIDFEAAIMKLRDYMVKAYPKVNFPKPIIAFKNNFSA